MPCLSEAAVNISPRFPQIVNYSTGSSSWRQEPGASACPEQLPAPCSLLSARPAGGRPADGPQTAPCCSSPPPRGCQSLCKCTSDEHLLTPSGRQTRGQASGCSAGVGMRPSQAARGVQGSQEDAQGKLPTRGTSVLGKLGLSPRVGTRSSEIASCPQGRRTLSFCPRSQIPAADPRPADAQKRLLGGKGVSGGWRRQL